MNKQQKYLNKVVNQLVNETIITGGVVTVPYPLPTYLNHPFPYYSNLLPSNFSSFVTKVYGLTEEEVKYVWEQYRSIIHDKI